MTVKNDNRSEPRPMVGENIGPCPWCGRSVAAELGDETKPASVMHGLPTCERFNTLDALSFVTEMRKEIERQRTGRPRA